LGYKGGECEAIWASFKRNGKITVRSLLYLARQDGWKPRRLHEPLTDVGNGRSLARECAGSAAYCRTWNKWLAWDGKRWRLDGEFEVLAVAKRIIRGRYDRAVDSLRRLGAEEEQKSKIQSINRVLRWCMESEDARHIHAALDMSRSEPGILVEADIVDQHKMILNCKNGVLDLVTMKLYPHNAALYLTQYCPTEYFEEAICPRWEQFVLEIFNGDAELVQWVQRFLGYCLTGSTAEHILPIMYGTGRNGKSTLIKTVMAVLGGDYAGTTPSGFLAFTRQDQHPTKIVELYRKRFVADLETSDGMKLNEELVKRITGGDELKARRMHEDFWSFYPTHKLVLATNYEPKIRGSDTAIWARIKKLPFAVSFEGREDKDLDNKLALEASGILRWMVIGCMEWQKVGLGTSAAVSDATKEYRSEQDSVAAFMNERTERQANNLIKKADFIAAYKQWCVINGIDPVSAKAFGQAMLSHSVQHDESGRHYVGVRLG
jgi:putative DNA primase/helicase